MVTESLSLHMLLFLCLTAGLPVDFATVGPLEVFSGLVGWGAEDFAPGKALGVAFGGRFSAPTIRGRCDPPLGLYLAPVGGLVPGWSHVVACVPRTGDPLVP